MRLALQTFIIIIYTLQQKAAGLAHTRGDANSRIDINLADIDLKEIWKKLQDFYKNTNMTVINTPNGNMTVINTLNDGNMAVMNTPSNYSYCKFDIRNEKDQDYSLRQSQAPRGRSNTRAKSKIQKDSHNY